MAIEMVNVDFPDPCTHDSEHYEEYIIAVKKSLHEVLDDIKFVKKNHCETLSNSHFSAAKSALDEFETICKQIKKAESIEPVIAANVTKYNQILENIQTIYDDALK